MANAMVDTRQEGYSYRRIELITGQGRRRRWTGEEKLRIVAESFEADANISEVARRNVSPLASWASNGAAMAAIETASLFGFVLPNFAPLGSMDFAQTRRTRVSAQT